MNNHTHNYLKGRGNVDVCNCGRFRFNEKAGPPIVEVTASHFCTRCNEPKQVEFEVTFPFLAENIPMQVCQECMLDAMKLGSATIRGIYLWRFI